MRGPMTSKSFVASSLSDGVVVACYGCERPGTVKGAEINWSAESKPDPSATARAVLCPACRRPKKETR